MVSPPSWSRLGDVHNDRPTDESASQINDITVTKCTAFTSGIDCQPTRLDRLLPHLLT